MPNEISKTNTSLLIVDSDLTSRVGLNSIISEFDHFEVTAVASVGEIELSCLNIDIILVVIKNNFDDYIKKLVFLKQSLKHTKYLVIQNNINMDQIGILLTIGIDGLINKPLEYHELVSAIMSLKWGGTFYPVMLRRDISSISLNHISIARSSDQFKTREIQIIQMIADGLTNKIIADRICLSERTVEWHRKKLISKANVKSTLELVLFAIDNGLIKSPYQRNKESVYLELPKNVKHAIAI